MMIFRPQEWTLIFRKHSSDLPFLGSCFSTWVKFGSTPTSLGKVDLKLTLSSSHSIEYWRPHHHLYWVSFLDLTLTSRLFMYYSKIGGSLVNHPRILQLWVEVDFKIQMLIFENTEWLQINCYWNSMEFIPMSWSHKLTRTLKVKSHRFSNKSEMHNKYFWN